MAINERLEGRSHNKPVPTVKLSEGERYYTIGNKEIIGGRDRREVNVIQAQW